jgi:putative ABC transport system permease protein
MSDGIRPARQIGPPDIRKDVDDEIAFHLEQRQREFATGGLDEAEAREAALRKFGNVAKVAADCREIDQRWYREKRRANMLNDLKLDIGYGVRSLVKAPGFSIVALLTLALGIGATTVMFSVVNAVLIRPLPFTDPDRLVTTGGSLADLRDLQAASRSFQDLALWASNGFHLRLDGEAQQVLGGQVTTNLFPLLGVQPLLGRGFSAEDDRQNVVVLSYALWQSRFGADPTVLGRGVQLSGASYTVIGIAPAWFRFPTAEFQLWTPLGLIDRDSPQQAANRAFRIFSGVGRLAPGVTVQQAQSDAEAISARLAREFPTTNQGVTFTVQRLYDRLVGDTRPALTLLLGIVGLLLLMACANVANLMLARTTVREREIAIRVALGASRGRLVRQLMTESITLAAVGGILGLVLTKWGIQLLPSVLEARVPRADGIGVDGAVLAFSAVATLLTGILFGLAPSLQAAHAPATPLKEGGRGAGGGARGRRVRRAIVAVQTALAVIVLVGAGLLVRSFLLLAGQSTGFATNNVVTFNVQFVTLPDVSSRVQAASQLIERLSQAPGIDAAGASTGLPIVTPQRATRFAIEGRTLNAGEDGAYFIAATPGYFPTLRAPVLRGRAIDGRDTATAAPVALINQTLAAQLFPGQDAIGHRLKLLNPEQSPEWRTIVGVVGDLKYRGLDEEPQPTVYTPFTQTPLMWLYVMVRTPAPFDTTMRTLRTVVPSVHPSLTAANIRPMNDVLAQSVAVPRFNMLLLSGFATLALVLSAIGIYGVIAYSVAQRTHEIGVRMALGAARLDVVRLVVKEAVVVAGAGIALGIGAAAMLSRLMATLLFGITARDPLTFTIGGATLLLVALGASWIPALRATRVEPVRALRAE